MLLAKRAGLVPPVIDWGPWSRWGCALENPNLLSLNTLLCFCSNHSHRKLPWKSPSSSASPRPGPGGCGRFFQKSCNRRLQFLYSSIGACAMCRPPRFVAMMSRQGQDRGNRVGLSSASLSAGEAAPTSSTQFLLAALSLLMQQDEQILEVEDNFGFLETAGRPERSGPPGRDRRDRRPECPPLPPGDEKFWVFPAYHRRCHTPMPG